MHSPRAFPRVHSITRLPHAPVSPSWRPPWLTAALGLPQVRLDPIARAAGEEGSGEKLRWVPRAAPEVGIHGAAHKGVGTGASCSDSNQQFVTMLGDDEMMAARMEASAGADAAILSQVPLSEVPCCDREGVQNGVVE